MTKLSRQNVGGIDYTMVGCTLTGVCASAASDYVKAVTLSDGDILADGMSVVITFANGNTAGTAPASQTIYSSDQVNYYSDSGLTQPFTLAPSGCYDIEYTGTGNAYTYTSYPVIQVEGVTAPLCDSCGKKTSGAIWDAGDTVLMLYSGNKFMVISGLTNVVTAGSKKAVTSGAVADAISSEESARNTAIANAIKQSDYLYDYTTRLDTPQWVKICDFGRRNAGATLELELFSSYYSTVNVSHIIKITYGWTDVVIEDLAKDIGVVFDKVRICWADDNTTKLGLYVHYNKSVENGIYCKIKSTSTVLVKAYTPNADPTTFADYKEFSLGTNGLYLNGALLDPVDYKCVHTVKVNSQNSRTITFGNWGLGLCMGNIDGAGNFAFYFARSGADSIAISNLTSLGTGFITATLSGNVITIGNTNCKISITFNAAYTVTISWTGANQSDLLYGRMAFISGNTIF